MEGSCAAVRPHTYMRIGVRSYAYEAHASARCRPRERLHTHISNAQLDVCEAACGSVGNPSASDFGLETHNLIKSTSRDTDNKWPPQKKCECACACVCVSAADANVCRA